MLCKLLQVRIPDKAVVIEFYDDSGNKIGSRGVNGGKDYDETLFDEVVSLTLSEFYSLKSDGFSMPATPSTAIEQIAQIAYDQFLQAKQQEEELSSGVIE